MNKVNVQVPEHLVSTVEQYIRLADQAAHEIILPVIHVPLPIFGEGEQQYAVYMLDEQRWEISDYPDKLKEEDVFFD